MTHSVFWLVGIASTITMVLLPIYRRLWIAVRGSEITPTGVGVFLPVACLAAALETGTFPGLAASLAVLVVATIVYWFDDLIELPARLRLGVSFVTGFVMCGLLITGNKDLNTWHLIGFCLAAGALNVVLTNVVNFYDGADLNLAVLIILTAAMMLLFGTVDNAMSPLAFACLAFVLPFAVFNSRPKTIYLGDSGSFAFASIVTIMAVNYLCVGDVKAEAAIPLALPLVDTFYVLCIRLIERHDLMTRNYLHLYQKLNSRFRGFGYLLPQIVNALVVCILATFLQSQGYSNFLSVILTAAVVTPVFYLACRKTLLPARNSEEVA